VPVDRFPSVTAAAKVPHTRVAAAVRSGQDEHQQEPPPLESARTAEAWSSSISRINSSLGIPRGGGGGDGSAPSKTYDARGLGGTVASLYATGGVLYILGKAIQRVLPIALEPFQKGSVPLSPVELGYVFCNLRGTKHTPLLLLFLLLLLLLWLFICCIAVGEVDNQ
jgi:hypothetical protein